MINYIRSLIVQWLQVPTMDDIAELKEDVDDKIHSEMRDADIGGMQIQLNQLHDEVGSLVSRVDELEDKV